jgi:hypothetical protein
MARRARHLIWRKGAGRLPACPEAVQTHARQGRKSTMTRYDETYARWKQDPQGWWAEAACAIAWDTPPARAFDPSLGI